MEIVKSFFQDARVMAVLGLIVLDVLLAIAAAIKAKTFEWRKMGEFYQTMVLPYILGYLAFYLFVTYFVKDWALLGPYADQVGEGVLIVAWLALVGNLVGDVVKSAKALAYKIEPE